LQDELSNVRAVLDPKRPFVAIVAGAKYDTKIGPLTAIYKRVDHLVLGGLIYNTFLCAKYGVKIKGVEVRTNLLHLCSSNTSYPLLTIRIQSTNIPGNETSHESPNL
jgi:3-phosphoglycerate kinase